MIDFFDQYNKKSDEIFRGRIDEAPEIVFFVRFVMKLSGGAIRNYQDALRVLIVVFIIFLLVSVYFIYRSRQSHVYDYLPDYLQKK